jgi:outer membrane scaffolding protein for murein synthesis (MipA/OmpV family)
VRDDDNDNLALDGLEDDQMLQIHGYSITYRIATGKLTARTKGLYLANHCTYGRARACVRLCIKCGRL